ncbi:MAG: glycosyltransferase family 4 protein [Actinomycetota bacterium]|nr:glycosyltransferase family 4 protein [Actinomycetota bacterium]
MSAGGEHGTARVLFINGTGDVSGAEKVLLSLVELAVHNGYRVMVACPDGPLVHRLPAAVAHLALPALVLESSPSLMIRRLSTLRLAYRYLGAAKLLRGATRAPDTRIVVNSLRAVPMIRLTRRRCRSTWLVHDTVHTRKQRALVRAGAARLRRVVAVSEPTAAPLRVMGLSVVTAANGVPWPVAPADLTMHDPPVVGCLALLTPWKGHAVLLDAVARLPDVRLELAGGAFTADADYVLTLHRRAEEPDLRGRVRFLGHVDAVRTLRSWDVAVSASIAPEAAPLSVLEAMSLGVPVVGTDHGGTSDILAGGAGLLVPPGDVAALTDALRHALSNNDFRQVSHHASRAAVAAEHDLTKTLPAMLTTLLAD